MSDNLKIKDIPKAVANMSVSEIANKSLWLIWLMSLALALINLMDRASAGRGIMPTGYLDDSAGSWITIIICICFLVYKKTKNKVQ